MISPYEVMVLLGAGFFYVLGAGLYAFLYAYGRLRGKRGYFYSSFFFAGLVILCAYLMVRSPLFSGFWKALLSFATFAYLLIPKGMWWVMERVHKLEEEERKRSKF